jgi:hypothetical protein
MNGLWLRARVSLLVSKTGIIFIIEKTNQHNLKYENDSK